MRIVVTLFCVLSFILCKGQDSFSRTFNLTLANDYSPTISFDGRTMVFESDRSGHWKLYESKRLAGDNWSEPRYMKEINDHFKRSLFVGGAFISYDDQHLLFTVDEASGNGNMDIWMSRKSGKYWGKPEALSETINSQYYEGFPSMSPDGRKLYFMRNFKPMEKPVSDRYYLYEATLEPNGDWSEPQLLQGQLNYYPAECPRILPDGKSLVFASKRPDSKGGFDLYMSVLSENGEWSLPVNMEHVNSPYDENTFTTDAEGRFHYFSQTKEGMDDIIRQDAPVKEDIGPVIRLIGQVLDSKTMKPVSANLNISILNSKELAETSMLNRSAYVVYLPKEEVVRVQVSAAGYFDNQIEISIEAAELILDTLQKSKYKPDELLEELVLDTEGARSNQKLQKKYDELITLQSQIGTIESFVEETKLAGYKGKSKKARDKIKKEITDFESKLVDLKSEEIFLNREYFEELFSILKANLENYRVVENSIVGEQGERLELAAGNDWKRAMEHWKRYDLAKRPADRLVFLDAAKNSQEAAVNNLLLAYESYLHYISFNSNQIKRNIYLDPIIKEETIVLKNINFDFDRFELRTGSSEEISMVLKLLEDNPEIRLEILAHTDNLGSEEYNLNLSQKRANSVVEYLILRGIDKERLLARGYGSQKPLLPNDSEFNRFQNRRVEFKIIE